MYGGEARRVATSFFNIHFGRFGTMIVFTGWILFWHTSVLVAFVVVVVDLAPGITKEAKSIR